MDPRPYFSERRWKRWLQRIESAARWRVKTLLIERVGGTTLSTREEFADSLRSLLEGLLQLTTADVVAVSHSGLDDRYFAGSLAAMEELRETTEQVVADLDSPRVWYQDLARVCNRWDVYLADRFHLNEAGHRRIAEALVPPLERSRRLLG